MTQNRQTEPANKSDGKREPWQQPDVTRIRAGEAESGAGALTEFQTGSS